MKIKPPSDFPCFCGSGRPYRQSCGAEQRTGPAGSRANSVFEEIRRALAEREFESIEEVQAFGNAFMAQRNRAPVDDFHGLSPEQMYRLLHFPFDTPQLFSFPDRVSPSAEAPILTLFLMLAEAAGAQGLKCTANGNLPRAFCREAAEVYRKIADPDDPIHFYSVGKELGFFELHVMRVVAQAAGLLRKHGGRFKLTAECRKLLGEAGAAAIYPCLFRAHVRKYNWAYADGYEALPFIQQSFLFTLYLLQRYGAEERPTAFYEDAFLRAFPVLLSEVEQQPRYCAPDRYLKNCYTVRALDRFAHFLGLVELRVISKGPEGRTVGVKKKPLLGEVVRFQFGDRIS